MAAGTIPFNSNGVIVDAGWYATSSSAALTRLTNTLTLPYAGNWLVFGVAPPSSGTLLGQPVGSSGVTIRANTYFNLEQYAPFLFTVSTSSANQTIYIASSSGTSTTFSYIERGWLKAVKLS